MSLRTRIAVIATTVLVLAGAGAATAAQADTLTAAPHNDACVVIPPAKVAICLGRF